MCMCWGGWFSHVLRNPKSFFAIQRSLFGLYTHEPTMFHVSCLFGGMK